MVTSEYRAQKDGELSPDPRRYITLLLANVRFICIVVAITSVAACIVSYVVPKQYMAECTVSIEQNIISDLVKGIALTPSADSKMRLLNVYLRSRNLLEQIISTLDMDLLVRTPQKKEALIQSLQDRIGISHNERRGVFTITFKDRDPMLASDFVNTMTRLYIEENTAEKRKESYDATMFLRQQIAVFEDRITKVQLDIDNFKAQKGMYLGLNEQLLRQQIQTLEQRLELSTIRKNELIAKQLLLSDTSVLADQLRAKELALQSARATYTERHPVVKRLMLETKGLKELIAQSEKNPTRPVSSAEYQTIQVELQSIAEMEANLANTLTERTKDLEELPAVRTELSEMEQKKAHEKRIYDQLVDRLSKATISKDMEIQDKGVSFRVIDSAIPPNIPVFPKRYLFMIGGIVGGFGLAVGIVLANDILRGKIRSSHDLRAYNIPILIKLPNTVNPAVLSRQKRVTSAFVLLTACLLLIICAAAAIEFLHLPYIERAIAAGTRMLSF